MTAQHTDIIIMGGGMVGLAQALALASSGARISVIDHAPIYDVNLLPDGRVSAIALSSKNLLDSIGAWNGMAEHAQAILDIRVSDGDSSAYAHYHYADAGTEPFGWIVENNHTRKALYEAAAKHTQITLHSPERLKAITWETNNVRVSLESGVELIGRLLIGADGKHSEVRNLAGIKTFGSAYGQTAIVCTIAHTEPHLGLAQERFLPAGPFAVLPMTGNRSSLVWVEPHANIAHFLQMDDPALAEEIKARTGDYLGNITVKSKRYHYPLTWKQAHTYIAPRTALVGDAAHAIHPLAGQGVNLGFRDAAALAEVIESQLALGLDPGDPDILARYQRWRRADNLLMLGATDGLNRLFSLNAFPIIMARRTGLSIVQRMPVLKRAFMQHAMGFGGRVPKRMQRAV